VIEVELGGGPWQLLAQRAALCVAERLLVVADVHLGKAATFHARGVPLAAAVADFSTAENLARLSALIETLAPRTLVFLGDLWHAQEALAPATVARVAAWRHRHAAVEMVLVEGNHDARAGAAPAELGLRIVEEPWPVAGVRLAHHPLWLDGATVLAGHLHPAVRVYGRADDSARLPCFWWRRRRFVQSELLLLPAFGEFTGGAAVRREADDRVLAVAGDRLFEIPVSGAVAA
jgi:DNA ligase-associated metallophosphoesterase